VRNAGPDAGISSLRVHGTSVYGTSWHFGPGGNLEGTFKASVDTGVVEWLTDCHGDVYSSFPQNGVVYSVGHAHYCGNMGGGFPQYSQWRYQHTQAWSDVTQGDILNDVYGYPNWRGRTQGPAMINWLPEMAMGTFTGQYQAGWSITGTGNYVVVGGEFPRVNGVNQQGLVRFAQRSLVQPRQGPAFPNNQFLPTLVPTSPTTVRVSWLAGFDRDDLSLRYEVYRAGVSTPRYTTTANSNWWTVPSLGFVDTGLTQGASYSYRIVARDLNGNTVNGASVSVTMPTTVATTAHGNRVRADGALIYWPLNETSGLNVTDRAGVNDGRGDNGVTWGRPGAIAGDTAASLGDNDWSRVYTRGVEKAPNTFSAQVWIKTTTTRGGRILGFGDLQNGNSGHRDRHVYMDNSGRITFGVRAQDNSTRTVTSPNTYNDGRWHQVTATMNSAGMRLFVDGAPNDQPVASRADTTAGESYLGYWRLGGDRLSVSGQPVWPGVPSSVNFIGDVDEMAIYPAALAPSTIQNQYNLRSSAPPANQAPNPNFAATVSGLTASVDATSSTDPDGSVDAHSWNWGDGSPAGSGRTSSHTYATAGTYTVALTVTDNGGATNTASQQVTVTAPPAGGQTFAADSFSRTVSGGFGAADVGGSWTGSSGLSVDAGVGRMAMLSAGTGPWAYLGSVSAAGVDATGDLSLDKAATGGGYYGSLVARRIGTSDYRLTTRITATGVTASLSRTVNGIQTNLTSQTVPGLVYSANQVIHLRVRVVGTGTTMIQGKVWADGQVEPANWLVTTTDATSALQSPGAVGFHSYLSGSATNAPVTARLDDLRVVAA
jgi:PKD repeat protein